MSPLDAHVLATTFGVIFVAELPDKTALAALLLATRFRPWPVFLGTALALTAQSVIAVTAGRFLSLVPAHAVRPLAGIFFLVAAVVMWARDDEPDAHAVEHTHDTVVSFWRPMQNSFLVVFAAEWGDLTQLGTAALAARYGRPLSVFVGATLALWCVAAIAVFVGNRARRWLNPTVTQKVAAVVFAVLGVALVSGVM